MTALCLMCAGLFDCENVREFVALIDAHIRQTFKDNNKNTYKSKSGENLAACFFLFLST